MPTNVSVEYANAEKEYQKAGSPQEQLRCLEEMLRTAPSHKGAENLRAEIKTKIAKIREKLLRDAQQKKGVGYSLSVKKEGAAQVVLVGPPNTGKSSVLNALTRAKSPVSHYPFTTTKPELGVLEYETVLLQIVDLPPFLPDAAIKQGPLFSIVRTADLVLLVIDDLSQLEPLLKEFSSSNIILNRSRPAIRIRREPEGGIEIIGEKLIEANQEDVRRILRENGINNATVEIFSKVTLDDFFQVLDEKLAYRPAFVVWNKQTSGTVRSDSNLEIIPVSATSSHNLGLLKKMIWEYTNLIKVFTKEPGKPATRVHPITLRKGSTLKNMAEFIHKDFLKKFNYARIWGTSAKHSGQTVGLDHLLADNDVVEIHLK